MLINILTMIILIDWGGDMKKYIDDIFLVLGMLMVTIASFMLSIVFGLYVLGAIFLFASYLLAKR